MNITNLTDARINKALSKAEGLCNRLDPDSPNSVYNHPDPERIFQSIEVLAEIAGAYGELARMRAMNPAQILRKCHVLSSTSDEPVIGVFYDALHRGEIPKDLMAEFKSAVLAEFELIGFSREEEPEMHELLDSIEQDIWLL